MEVWDKSIDEFLDVELLVNRDGEIIGLSDTHAEKPFEFAQPFRFETFRSSEFFGKPFDHLVVMGHNQIVNVDTNDEYSPIVVAFHE